MTRRKNIFWGVLAGFIVAGFLLCLGIYLLPDSAQAGEVNMEVGETLGYETSDLIEIILNIVRWALGLLGLVAVIFVIYGGYLWMTAHGNDEQILKAKRVLRDAVIGLVIVLLAWAIVSYVIGVITNSSSGGATGCYPTGQCIGCNEFCQDVGGVGEVVSPYAACEYLCGGGVVGENFLVQKIYPADGATNITLCTAIQAEFNDDVDDGSLDYTSSFKLALRDDPDAGIPVSGTFEVVDNVVAFFPDDDLLQERWYVLTLTSAIQSTGGDYLFNSQFIEFETGTEEDTVPPIVLDSDLGVNTQGRTTPLHGQDAVCTNTVIAARFNEPMLWTSVRGGSGEEATVRLYYDESGEQVYLNEGVSWFGPDAFAATLQAVNAPLESFTDYQANLRGGTDTYAIRDVCGNPLDGQGGPANPPNAPDGVEDDADTDKYNWDFLTGDNPDCDPVIFNFDPASGYYTETEVTITGQYFGAFGDVIFHNNVYDDNNCFDGFNYPREDCITDWADDQITVKVPASTEGSAPLKINNGKIATSADNYTNLSPQINWISPVAGGVGKYMTIRGENFGTNKGTVWFRKWEDPVSNDIAGVYPPEAECGNTWTDDQIIVTVPPGFTVGDNLRVQIEKTGSDNRWSNQKSFQLTDDPPGPGLCKIQPTCGAAGQTVELWGERFGSYVPTETVVNFNTTPALNYASWGDQYIQANTRDDMENGSYLTRVFSGGLASNPLVYDIPCGDTPYIVNDSTCDLETDPDNPIWPSPNPRPNATNVCVNAVVAARFGPDGVEMDEGTLAPNIEYKKCNWETGDGFQSTGCSEEVDYTFDFIDADQEFRLNTAHLEANRWYQVVVHKEVETDDEARMNSDFSWHFRTKDDEGVCPLAHLILNDLGPDPVGEINYIDETKGDNFEQYRAEPLGQDCMLLNDDDYTYLWSSANIDIATVDSVSTDTNQATAEGNGYTVIRVQAEDKVAQKGLIVNYCDESTDCTDYDGDPATGPECPESICDIETNKCTPDITDLDPADGAPGTCVSVNGCYFRDSGSIKFSDEVNAAANLCGAPWQDFQVVSEVPEGAVTGPLTLRNNYGLEATADFTVNDTVHPCLCQIYPDTGLNIHDLVNFYGYGFTSASGDQQASFNGIEAASYGTWTDTKLEQAEVPVGTTAGQARVTIDGNDSNGIAYTMDAGPPTCTTNPDPAICDPDPTLCPPDTECNTACICVEIPEGPVEGGACDGDTSTPGICDPDNELCHPDAVCQAPDCTCQWNAFTLDEWLPETETCTSGLITMQFSQPVDSVTARAVDADSQYTNIKLLKEGTEYIPGRIGVYGKFVIFSPSAALEEETSYTMKISPALESTREQTFSGFSWDFLAKGPCTLSRIGVTLLKTENGDVTNYGPPDLFTCKLLTGCEDDYDTTADGNQHHVLGIGYEAGGNPVNADFSMVLNGSYSDGVLSPLAITETTGYLEADIYPKSDLTVASGIDQIDLEATDEVYIPAEMEPHVIAQSFLAKVFICDNPWPSAGDFPFRDNDYDFETYYCMDGGLPNFNSGYNAPISPVGEDQFLRQYIMTQDLATEVGDVIGIRIMPNMEHYSPSEWYRKAFGDGAGHPYSTQIDGYEAVRDGRSLYINAAKTGGTSYTNMYIISYDQEESACNVAENSSFENGTDDWTVSGSVSIADGVGEQVDDAQSVQLTSSGSETRVSQEFTNLEIGQSYDISGWVRADFAEGNKGQVGIIAECIGLRCQGGDNDGQKCKIADDCPGGGGCSEGVVKDPACGLYKSSFDIYGSEEDPDLVNEDHPGYLPWTKVSYQVNHNSVGYRLRVSCINSTIAPGASGSGTSWCDFIQVEPSGACGISFVQQIYNQMVDNLTFNTNIGNLDESLRLRRDVKRLGQLTYINNYLERYQDNNGELPELEELDVEAGSYLRNMTTSIWPSWQWRLGNAVGKGLPVDPLHTEGICEPPYHPDTCWDEDNYKFRSRADTYVYSYVVNPDTDTARLYGHFEYPTNWDCEVFPFSDNPCPVASDCICEGGDCGFNRYIKVNELCPAP